jgi:arginyl-tRNA synthetase
MLKKKIAAIIEGSLERCKEKGTVPHDLAVNPIIEPPREEEHGDYSSNIAFFLAPKLRKSPSDIAKMLIDGMVFDDVCSKVEVAGKGFVNFYVKDSAWRQALKDVHRAGIGSLYPNIGGGKRVLVEFVSSNPTGPLHIGHGRGAAVGDVLSNLLKKTGYDVVKEYYVNDAGKQIHTLGESTYLRWKELKGESVEFAENLYQGAYVKDIAAHIIEKGPDVPEDREEAVKFMASFASE